MAISSAEIKSGTLYIYIDGEYFAKQVPVGINKEIYSITSSTIVLKNPNGVKYYYNEKGSLLRETLG